MGISGAPSGVGLRTLHRQLSHLLWLQAFGSSDISGHCEIDKTVKFAFGLDTDSGRSTRLPETSARSAEDLFSAASTQKPPLTPYVFILPGSPFQGLGSDSVVLFFARISLH